MGNSEEITLKGKPKNIISNAIKVVKGENTNQLVEQFTSEMVLVAEGLCEDQNKLRGEVDKIINEEDRRIQKQESRIDSLESKMNEERNELDQVLYELRSRISNIEKRETKDRKAKSRTYIFLKQLTLLIGIAAAAWVIVTVINKVF